MAKKVKKTHRKDKKHLPHTFFHEWGVLPMRLAIGIVFVMHGIQKMMMGMAEVSGFFVSAGLPSSQVLAVLVTAIEFVGGLCILLGLFTRWAALVLAVDMIIAFVFVHVSNGFFVGNGGFEFVLVLFLVNVGLFFHGAGIWSLERTLTGKEL
ncbi:DoxX family membrane protein [Candidatus Woesearchaeota archaeon]|nr:DoxX family membrane protein [Candidatus Woesearchaeota archaeon]